MKEHDAVALLADRPTDGMRRGDVGAIVHCHKDGTTFEVEFIDVRGRSRGVVTVCHDQLLRLNVIALSASGLAKDWNRPEEDAAWNDL